MQKISRPPVDFIGLEVHQPRRWETHATVVLQRPTMRVIFSRKGFDSAAGKAPAPIIEGEPISLPIPTERRSETSYRLAGLEGFVEHMTKGRIGADDLCHEDPVFLNGRWAFGQVSAAQSPLKRNGDGIGDVFLFFGLFASHEARDRHHRIFGYLKCADRAAFLPKAIIPLDSCGDIRIRSESGTRTTRFTSAQAPKRGARILIYVSASLILRFQSGAFRHGSKRPV